MSKLLGFVTVVLVLAGFHSAVFAQIAPPELNRSLFLGLRGDDVKSLQEYFAQDKEIYPEGLVTGYFGLKTETAVKKWQQKNSIEPAGIVGPKTRAKLKELRVVQTVTPATSETPQPTTPAGETPAAQQKPAPSIKSGFGTASNNKLFSFGLGQLQFFGAYGFENRGFIGPGEPASYVANLTKSEVSSCEDVSGVGYSGVNNICQFTDSGKYVFSEHKEGVRVYGEQSVYSTGAKVGTCHQGIMLIKQGEKYGAIKPIKIDYDGSLSYQYWYDESGGSDFSSLCSAMTRQQAASTLETLKNALIKLQELLRNQR